MERWFEKYPKKEKTLTDKDALKNIKSKLNEAMDYYLAGKEKLYHEHLLAVHDMVSDLLECKDIDPKTGVYKTSARLIS